MKNETKNLIVKDKISKDKIKNLIYTIREG